MDGLRPFLLAWRTVALRDREVVDALVHPAHAGPSPELARVLEHWPGPRYWSDEDGVRHLVLIRPTLAKRSERWGLHLLLLGATLVTTLFAGALFSGVPAGLPRGPNLEAWWRTLAAGWSYAVPLLAILLAHELGHYLAARRYAIDASPPYFLPWWPYFLFYVGTLGAFIRLRSPVADRRQLLDVGAAGPFAGFAVALPILIWGVVVSHPLGAAAGAPSLEMPGTSWVLGHSVVTRLTATLLHGDAATLILHPAAFAGWLGIFVTMLNLIPLAQLDGGHILYATVGRQQRRIAPAVWVLLLVLSWWWLGWLVWALLILLLGRGQLAHPPLLDDYRPLPPHRRTLALGSLALFVLTFTPVPVQL